jgi:TfoX/Sxy family transcriptional regulator of competence genes
MAYDPVLADRVRVALGDQPGVVEKHMFGGIAFMLNGHMCVGLVKAQLMLRIRPEEYDKFLEREGVYPMEFTGRPMRGFVFIDAEKTATIAAVRRWIQPALFYVLSLPAKEQKKKAARPTARKPARKK